MVELSKSMLEALTADCKMPGDMERLFSGRTRGVEELEVDPSLEAGIGELPGDVRR